MGTQAEPEKSNSSIEISETSDSDYETAVSDSGSDSNTPVAHLIGQGQDGDYDSSSDDGYFDEINFWEHPTDHPYANITIYHDISHYMNGLTINGSPLIRHGCLLQREVERSINNFQCPQCLRPTDVTVATHVNISLRWLEVYQGPSLPFQGFGRTVGDDRCFELESMYFQRFIPSGMPVAGPTMSTLSFTFIHNVDVWRNGFTIYGGNLMSYNPMNAHLLLGIKKFKCLLIPPYSMITVSRSRNHLNIMSSYENYPEPEKQNPPPMFFPGVGRILGRGPSEEESTD